MLFYRDKTLEPSDCQCPLCKGELQPSFLLPVLHDIGVVIEYLAITLAVMFLSFLAIYQVMVHMDIDYSVLPTIDWGTVAKIVLVACMGIGLIASHFVMKRHLTLTYWLMGYTLKEARYCPKCHNRFLVVVSDIEEAEDDIDLTGCTKR